MDPLRSIPSVDARKSTELAERLNVDEVLESAAVTFHDGQDSDDYRVRDSYEFLGTAKSAPWHKKPSLLMISSVFFVLAFAYGFSLAPKLELTLQLICRSQAIDDAGAISDAEKTSVCDQAQAQADMSALSGIVAILSGIITMSNSSKLGQLSDIYGRKLIMSWLAFLLVMTYAIELVLLSPSENIFHRKLLIFAGCLFSLGGGMAVFYSVSYSYVIDIVKEDQRIFSLGLLTAAESAGICVGPIMSSQLRKYVFSSSISSLLTSGSMLTVVLLFIIFILPESRSEVSKRLSRDDSISAAESRRNFSISLRGRHLWEHHATETFKALFAPLKLLWLPVLQDDGSYDYSSRFILLVLVVLDVLWSLSVSAIRGALVLYALYSFSWDSVQLGYFISLIGASKAMVLAVVSPFLLNFIKSHYASNKFRVDRVDMTTLMIAFLFQFIALSGMIFTKSSTMFILATALEGFGSLYTPALRAAVVKYSPEESTGAMLGAISAVDGFVFLVGPPLFLMIYSATVKTQPKTFLFVALGILGSCGSILFLLSGFINKSSDSVQEDDYEQTA